jgi:hypothetical protein
MQNNLQGLLSDGYQQDLVNSRTLHQPFFIEISNPPVRKRIFFMIYHSTSIHLPSDRN